MVLYWTILVNDMCEYKEPFLKKAKNVFKKLTHNVKVLYKEKDFS